MARKTRRTTVQRVAGLATMGLPSPIKTVAGSRVGAPLTLLAMGALLITGVVTVEWSNGFPSIAVDRQRAGEVQHNLVERVENVVENVWEEQMQGAVPGYFAGSGGQPSGVGMNPGVAPNGPAQGTTPWQATSNGGTNGNWGNSGGGYPAYQAAPQTYGAPAPGYGTPASPTGPYTQPYYNAPPQNPNYYAPAAAPNANYGQPVAPNYQPPAAPATNPAQPESGLSRLRDVLKWNR